MNEARMLKPRPRVTELNRPFWNGCNEGRLVIQKCRACARAVFYPRACCPFCKAGDLDWIVASGWGRIISHTTVHRTHHDSFNAEAPYVFAAVALDEGPAMYGQVVGAPTADTSLIGRAVTTAFVEHVPGQKIAAFRLAN
jgi:uncharacterized OB-fold protein